MGSGKTRLVVGLGNPGRKYRHTRHNCGFMVIDALADAWQVGLDDGGKNIAYGCHFLAEKWICLAKPLTYMNRSGPPVGQLVHRLNISNEELIIVHDDLDLAFGRLKIKAQGGSGGHKGVKSIMETLGGGEFTRLRVGIGRPTSGIEITDFVLRPFDQTQQAALPSILNRAAEAVEMILGMGTLESMNRFNQKTDVTEL